MDQSDRGVAREPSGTGLCRCGGEGPFPLACCRHQHRILAVGEDTLIGGDILFKCRPAWLGPLLYPLLYLLFWYRKAVCRRRFARGSSARGPDKGA